MFHIGLEVQEWWVQHALHPMRSRLSWKPMQGSSCRKGRYCLIDMRRYEDRMREEALRRRLDRLKVADAIDAATAAADDPQEATNVC
jgi:hypothetical protein